MKGDMFLWLGVVFIIIAPSHGAGIRGTSFVSLKCSGTSCSECLSNGCAWTPVGNSGRCMASCSVLADASCYSTSSTDTPAQVCERVETNQADQQKCSAATEGGCGACTSALQSDGATTCQWTEETQSCGTAGTCSMFGCGKSTCPSSKVAKAESDPLEPPSDSSCSLGSCMQSWDPQKRGSIARLVKCLFKCTSD
jgi:hypothetical protein